MTKRGFSSGYLIQVRRSKGAVVKVEGADLKNGRELDENGSRLTYWGFFRKYRKGLFNLVSLYPLHVTRLEQGKVSILPFTR